MAWREWMRREFAEESDGMAKGASSVRDGAIKVTLPIWCELKLNGTSAEHLLLGSFASICRNCTIC